MLQADENVSPQPFLPAFSIRWMFALMVLIAVGISVYIQNTIDRTLLVVLALMGGIACIFVLLSAVSFLMCNMFGTLGDILDPSKHQPQSPFAGDRLPPQIVPRKE
jgi:formate hydrogenlyase subunit 4